MHHSTPPDWRASRPTFHHDESNGHQFEIGQSLGLLVAQSHQQIRVLEQISHRLDGLPVEIADAMPKPPTPPSAPLSLKDRIYLMLAVAIVVLALLGKIAVHEAAQMLLGGVKL